MTLPQPRGGEAVDVPGAGKSAEFVFEALPRHGLDRRIGVLRPLDRGSMGRSLPVSRALGRPSARMPYPRVMGRQASRAP